MTTSVFGGVVGIELIVLAWSIRRSGFLVFPHAFLFYLIGGEAIVYMNVERLIENDFLPLFSTYQFESHFASFNAILLGLFLLSASCAPRLTTATAFRLPNVAGPSLVAIVALLYARAIVHLLLLDTARAWNNDQYTLLGSDKLIDGPAILAQTQALWSFAVAAIFFFLLFGEQRRVALYLLPLALWEFWFEIASHSRMAFAMAGVGAMIAAVRRRSVPLITGLGVFSLVLLMNALAGRSQSQQGLSSIFLLPSTIASTSAADLIAGANNSFEGMFVTSELFSGSYDFPAIYKLLSLSPLPSFIDGFATVNRQYQIGLNPYVPMSAVQELVNFGPLYCLAYAVAFLVAGRASASELQRRPTVPSLLANALVTLGAVLQMTYPVRNSFRFFVLAIGIAFTLRLLSRRRAGPRSTMGASLRSAPMQP